MIRPAALVAMLVLTLLTGCGESPEDVRADYCDAVGERQAELSEILAEQSPAALLEALPVFRDLADAAPRDITDDWARVTDALTSLREALDAADVDPATYDADRPPADLTPAQERAITRAADDLARPEVADSLASVEQQAKDVCGTPLFR